MDATRSQDQYVGQISYATHCLREVGDRDYISARSLFRLGLVEQALWSSLQALEKLLKSVLLYNGESCEGFGHELVRPFDKIVREVKDIAFDFPGDLKSFLSHLEINGRSRYRDQPLGVLGGELFQVDEAFWNIRRYCMPLVGPLATGLEWDDCPGRRDPEVFPAEIRRIQNPHFKDNPHRFPFKGYISEVLSGRHGRLQRETLIWKNLYFGTRRKDYVRGFRRGIFSVPPHFGDLRVYASIKGHVLLPRKVVRDLDTELLAALNRIEE